MPRKVEKERLFIERSGDFGCHAKAVSVDRLDCSPFSPNRSVIKWLASKESSSPSIRTENSADRIEFSILLESSDGG